MKHKINIKRIITDFLLSIFGIVSASIGLKSFLIANQFLDGGVTGLSLLLNRTLGFDISLLIIVINLPFIVLGYKQISRSFAVKSFFTIVCLAFIVHLIHIPVITSDKLLISVFGGIFLGAGIGFSVRGGTVIDGTEILALYLSKKFRTTLGTIILILNIFLFAAAALLINVEIALYSILTYITASKAADFIIHGIEEYIGVTIVSPKSEEIRIAITEELGYGATIYRGKRGFRSTQVADNELEIIHTVITRLEINKLHSVVESIDDKAFIVEYKINDTQGGIIKKKNPNSKI